MHAHKASGGVALPVVINNVSLVPIEVDGVRVVTLAMIDKVHGRPDGTARKRFNDNRSRMVEGKHYFVRNSDEAAQLGITAPRGLTVLSERGYLMLAKSLTDDLAWEVQDRLVEAYFAKAANAAPGRAPRIDVVRESRMQMAFNLRLAKMAGLSGNQALLAADRATTVLTGVSALSMMGATHLPAPQNDALLTPTEIGRRTGIGSARAVNARLCLLGLQWQFRDAKGHIYYEPTDTGLAAGAVMQDTAKAHSDGTPVRQLKWASSIIDLLKGKESAA